MTKKKKIKKKRINKTKKKKLILIESNKIKCDKKTEIKSINGGYLMQENNSIFFSKKAISIAPAFCIAFSTSSRPLLILLRPA